MGIGELLDSSISLARRNYRAVFTVAAWVIIPAFVLGAILRALSGGELEQSAIQGAIQRQEVVPLALRAGIQLAIAFLVGAASGIATIALTIGYAELIDGVDAEPFQAEALYRAAASRILPL